MKTIIASSVVALLLTACSTPSEPEVSIDNSSSVESVLSVNSESSTSLESVKSASSLLSVKDSSFSSAAQSVTTSKVQSSLSASEVSVTTFTLAEVSQHASEGSCYTVVDGNVYDITSYIPYHPGGKRDIMKICGRDGSSLFNGKHGRDQKANDQLQKLYIGTLSE